MKKILSAIVIILFATAGLNAQQNLFPSQTLKSAEVNEDNSVTFKFLAPKAHQVQIVGDFMSFCLFERSMSIASSLPITRYMARANPERTVAVLVDRNHRFACELRIDVAVGVEKGLVAVSDLESLVCRTEPDVAVGIGENVVYPDVGRLERESSFRF